MKKKISILGSTGSIGLNSLKIISKSKNKFTINILAANKNYKLICEQIIQFKPKIFFINDKKTYIKVKDKFKKRKIIIINDLENKKFILKSDITISAIPGIAGLKPTIELTKTSKKILIANKESIISGWELIKQAAINYNTKIIPIDSEHFSILKLLENHKIEDVKKIYLTASGGPFLNYKISKMKNIKPQQAIKHPKWKMGKKISIDSATLMNKMFEVIEAHKLFSIDLKNIEIVIHPQSLVHAIVELKNGLYKFIYHHPTMIIPIANAIFEDSFIFDKYMKSSKNNYKKTFENLNFLEVNKKKYPIINLKKRMNQHNSTPTIINAVNEILVDQFLKKKIAFTSFYTYFLNVLDDRNYKKYAIRLPKNIKEILEIDQWARNTTYSKILNSKHD